jgi:formate hydrogenlyase subunit 3/multisubunit Na+/H+ antiporter MnhD subunit
MPAIPTPSEFVTPGAGLLVLALIVPVMGILAAIVAGRRHVERTALATIALGAVVMIAIAWQMRQSGRALVYWLGAWAPPLGVTLRADTASVVMLLVTVVVVAGIAVYARADFRTPDELSEARRPSVFWIMLLAVWCGLNAVFVASDLFTLYVALELLTFAAMPLVCLDGRAETLQAALRYLLFALAGSVLYLLGAVLVFGAYGTLDITQLGSVSDAQPATIVACVLMTTGLLAKTALFPLHLWLPPAHGGAPPAASAVLSALVVKGSFFIVIRIWFDALPTVPGQLAAQVLAGLGAGAILFGSVIALRQQRLKLLIAYSTLAQIGYLFLMFPLAFDAEVGGFVHGDALTGGLLQAMSHATAKAAMFMAAGLIYTTLGHDRLGEMAGVARLVPLSVLAFAVGGVALMGVLPSGAYLAKKLLLDAADGSGQWWWAVTLQAGGFLTTSYVVLVIALSLGKPAAALVARARVARSQEAAALALAVCSLGLAFAALGPLPGKLISNPLAPAALLSSAGLIGGGALLALAISRELPRLAFVDAFVAAARPLRRALGEAGEVFVQIDQWLRRWPIAGLSMLALLLLFGVSIVAGR